MIISVQTLNADGGVRQVKDHRFKKICRKFDKKKLCLKKNPVVCDGDCFIYMTTHKSLRPLLSSLKRCILPISIILLGFYFVLDPYIYAFWVGIYQPNVVGRYINYKPSNFNNNLDGAIVLYLRNTDNDELYITMLHELGHHCYKSLPNDVKLRWLSLNMSMYVTSYAATDPEENFAESFVSYHHPTNFLHEPQWMYFTPEPQYSFFKYIVEEECNVYGFND